MAGGGPVYRSVTIGVLAIQVILCNVGKAQEASPYEPPPPSSVEVLQVLKDSLFDLRQEIQLLQHFLEASTVDARDLRNTNLRSWRLDNPVLRDSLFSVLVRVDSSVVGEAGAEAIVLATLEDDLVEVRFGNVVFKGVTLDEAIGRSGDRNLYHKVADSYRYSQDIELRDPEVRLPTPYHPEFMEFGQIPVEFTPGPMQGWKDRHVAAELSLTGLSVQAGDHWGGEVRLGFDEANLPFWTSGTAQLLATYDRAKFGVLVPVYGGRYGSGLFPPFTIRPRHLNGAPGVAASMDFGAVGASLAFLNMNGDYLTSLTDTARFSYLSGFVILYSSFGVELDRSSYARAKLGAGVRRILQAAVVPGIPPAPDNLRPLGQQTAVSPYVTLEYLRNTESGFIRAGVQFFDLTVNFFGSLEIIPNVLSIEARYLWPVAPSLREWENPDYLLVSPKLRIGL